MRKTNCKFSFSLKSVSFSFLPVKINSLMISKKGKHQYNVSIIINALVLVLLQNATIIIKLSGFKVIFDVYVR